MHYQILEQELSKTIIGNAAIIIDDVLQGRRTHFGGVCELC